MLRDGFPGQCLFKGSAYVKPAVGTIIGRFGTRQVRSGHPALKKSCGGMDHRIVETGCGFGLCPALAPGDLQAHWRYLCRQPVYQISIAGRRYDVREPNC